MGDAIRDRDPERDDLACIGLRAASARRLPKLPRPCSGGGKLGSYAECPVEGGTRRVREGSRGIDEFDMGGIRERAFGKDETLCKRAGGWSPGPKTSESARCRRSGSDAEVAFDEIEKVLPRPPGTEKVQAGAERPDSIDKTDRTSSSPSRRRVLCRLKPPDDRAADRPFGGEETYSRLVSSMICGIRSDSRPFILLVKETPE